MSNITVVTLNDQPIDRKSTRLNSSHERRSRMPSCCARASGRRPYSPRPPKRWRLAACWAGRPSPRRPGVRDPACTRTGAWRPTSPRRSCPRISPCWTSTTEARNASCWPAALPPPVELHGCDSLHTARAGWRGSLCLTRTCMHTNSKYRLPAGISRRHDGRLCRLLPARCAVMPAKSGSGGSRTRPRQDERSHGKWQLTRGGGGPTRRCRGVRWRQPSGRGTNQACTRTPGRPVQRGRRRCRGRTRARRRRTARAGR